MKRAHSADKLEETPRKTGASTSPPTGLTPQIPSDTKRTPPIKGGISNSLTPSNLGGSTSGGASLGANAATGAGAATPGTGTDENQPMIKEETAIIGSPMKKSRPSLAGAEDDAVRKRLGLGLFGSTGEALAGVTTFGSPALSTSGGGGPTSGGIGIKQEQVASHQLGLGLGPQQQSVKQEGTQQQGDEDVMIKDAEEEQQGSAKLDGDKDGGGGGGIINVSSSSSS